MRGNGGVKLTSRTASLLVILLDGVGQLIEEREVVGLMGIEEKEKVRFYMQSAAFCLVIGKCYRGYISYEPTCIGPCSTGHFQYKFIKVR